MLENRNIGIVEDWNAGIVGFKPILPLLQRSSIPVAFFGGIFNGS